MQSPQPSIKEMQETTLQMLSDSPLAPSVFKVTPEFASDQSYAVFIGEHLAVLTGPLDSERALSNAECLCITPFAVELFQCAFHTKDTRMSVRKINNADYFTIDEKAGCILPSTQGQLGFEKKEHGTLLLVTPSINNALLVGMCISNSVIRIIRPDAKPLDTQIRFFSSQETMH